MSRDIYITIAVECKCILIPLILTDKYHHLSFEAFFSFFANFCYLTAVKTAVPLRLHVSKIAACTDLVPRSSQESENVVRMNAGTWSILAGIVQRYLSLSMWIPQVLFWPRFCLITTVGFFQTAILN